MAARKRAGLSERTRERIQTTMIVKRLMDHISGKVEMSQTQITAALGLLRKTLPDLSATELSGEVEYKTISNKPLSDDEWQRKYSLETADGASKSIN